MRDVQTRLIRIVLYDVRMPERDMCVILRPLTNQTTALICIHPRCLRRQSSKRKRESHYITLCLTNFLLRNKKHVQPVKRNDNKVNDKACRCMLLTHSISLFKHS